MSKTDQRTAFYASVRAIDAMCPACKQPQNAPSCERREHWLPSPASDLHTPDQIAKLIEALEAADLYLNSYDTSKPSRIKAETRAIVAEALAL